MTELIEAALLLVFLIHLGVFARLGLRRRQGYYIALCVTFALLSAAAAARLAGVGEGLAGAWSLADLLRAVAIPAAVVSVTWTIVRVRQRRRDARASAS